MNLPVHKHIFNISWIMKIVFLALLIIFIGRYVLANWQTVLTIGAPDVSWILIGSCFALVSILISPWVYKSLVQAYGYQLSYTTVLGVQSVSRLGKYIPGRIWIALIGVWLYSQAGVPKKVAAASIILISIFSILGASIIVSLGAWWIPIPRIIFGLVLVVTTLLFVIHPRIFYPVVNFGLSCINRKKIMPPNFQYTLILRLIIIYSVIWLVYGIGFYFLVRSYTPLSAIQIFPLVSIFALAQVTGFLVVIVPAGLGVREGILLLGLIPIVGEGQAIVLVGLCRLWQTALEMLMTLIGAYIVWYKKMHVFKRTERALQ